MTGKIGAFSAFALQMQSLEHLLEGSPVSPKPEAVINRSPRPTALGHVTPGSSRAQQPKHSIEHQAIA
jgi:hypothetical protein